MFPIIFMQFVSFPSRKDAIFESLKNSPNEIRIEATGSLGLYYFDEKKCHQTYPNHTLVSTPETDWCSTIAPNNNEKPYITYSLRNKIMKINGYSVRNGCCRHRCCCLDDNKPLDDYCCCELYSFSLQGSNDNQTWTVLHKVEKESRIRYCESCKYYW